MRPAKTPQEIWLEEWDKRKFSDEEMVRYLQKKGYVVYRYRSTTSTTEWSTEGWKEGE